MPPYMQGGHARRRNPALSLSVGPDQFLIDLVADAQSKLPVNLHPRVSDVVEKYRPQLRQAIINRAVAVYSNDFMDDVRRLIPHAVKEALNL